MVWPATVKVICGGGGGGVFDEGEVLSYIDVVGGYGGSNDVSRVLGNDCFVNSGGRVGDVAD